MRPFNGGMAVALPHSWLHHCCNMRCKLLYVAWFNQAARDLILNGDIVPGVQSWLQAVGAAGSSRSAHKLPALATTPPVFRL